MLIFQARVLSCQSTHCHGWHGSKTGQRPIHYTLLSVQITLTGKNRRLSECVARPQCNKREQRSRGEERRGAETDRDRNKKPDDSSKGVVYKSMHRCNTQIHTHTAFHLCGVFSSLWRDKWISDGRVSRAWWGQGSLKPCGPPRLPRVLDTVTRNQSQLKQKRAAGTLTRPCTQSGTRCHLFNN